MNSKSTVIAVLAAAGLLVATGSLSHEDEAKDTEVDNHETGAMMQDGMMQGGMMQGGQMMTMPGMDNLMMPNMDPALGRKLFASKGCVTCHSINGVGGHEAAALDAHTMRPMMNPFEFAAKMWSMAPSMIAAQEEALGEQILFSGEELANIIAFVHDHAEQHKFSEADIPPEIWPMMHHHHGADDEHDDDEHHGDDEHLED